MPVGLNARQGLNARHGGASAQGVDSVRAAGPSGFNPLALWIAAAAPVAATLLLLSRLAA